jgi:hypothetical protein
MWKYIVIGIPISAFLLAWLIYKKDSKNTSNVGCLMGIEYIIPFLLICVGVGISLIILLTKLFL